AKGVVHAAVHLDQTVSNLVKLNTPEGQINFGLAAYYKGKQVQQQWNNGSLNDRAELAGAGAGELLQLLGGEVTEVGKVGEVSKIAEVSEDVGRSADAGLAAEEAADVGISELPNQIHHFATNKNSIFTKQMSAIAKKYGLDLDEAWNKASLPHLGRHPNAYHNFVLEGMQRASMEAGENQNQFLQLFDKYVKQPVFQNPNLLRKSGW
ncbi:MAG: AHH domain-containing protein, partial [Bacteroidota bacterium]|nr:AHH domain-containing protein [Bacteroidota bacterium]